MKCYVTVYPIDFTSTKYVNALNDAVCLALQRRFPNALNVASIPLGFYIRDRFGKEHIYTYLDCKLEPHDIVIKAIFNTWDNKIEDILQENYYFNTPIRVDFSFEKDF